MQQPSENVELPFQQGVPLREDDTSKIYNPDREIFMAIISEIEYHKDNPAERVDLIDYNSSEYDEFLSDGEATETAAINYEIPPPPPRVTATMHLDDEHNKLNKIRKQKRGMRCRLATERRQQLSDSFDNSNSDLRNIINIMRGARTVIINRRKEREEDEAYSPTSNYRLPDNCECNSRKRHHDSPIFPPPSKQSKSDIVRRRLHAQCFLQHNVFYIPKQSTRVSNASTSTKL